MLAFRQPRLEIFDHIHNLILLATGGRIAYCGPPCLLKQYFFGLGYTCAPEENPADFVMDVLAGASESLRT